MGRVVGWGWWQEWEWMECRTGCREWAHCTVHSNAMTVLIIVSVDSVSCGLQLSFHRSSMLFLIKVSIISITAASTLSSCNCFSVLAYYCSVLIFALGGLVQYPSQQWHHQDVFILFTVGTMSGMIQIVIKRDHLTNYWTTKWCTHGSEILNETDHLSRDSHAYFM